MCNLRAVLSTLGVRCRRAEEATQSCRRAGWMVHQAKRRLLRCWPPPTAAHQGQRWAASEQRGAAAALKRAQPRPAALGLAGPHRLALRHQHWAVALKRLLVLRPRALLRAHRGAVLAPAGGGQGGGGSGCRHAQQATETRLLLPSSSTLLAASGSAGGQHAAGVPSSGAPHLRSGPSATPTQQSSWHSAAGACASMCSRMR